MCTCTDLAALAAQATQHAFAYLSAHTSLEDACMHPCEDGFPRCLCAPSQEAMEAMAKQQGGRKASVKLNNVLMQMRKNCNHPGEC